MLRWASIETVFLDMDGTLLDLHFDDYFWREHVPKRYAEKNGLGIQEARESLFSRYQSFRGTLEWYSVDFWSQELDLDIEVLKHEIDHLIDIHPFVPEFLDKIRSLGKRAVLVTNAHGKSLDLKMKRTRLGNKLDSLICAHDIGIPKEDPQFWYMLNKTEPFNIRTTLLVDDNRDVLLSARSYGIEFLIAISKPNSKQPAAEVAGFTTVENFREILPF
jgi:putative hydrolase of the HAD superfamily